MAAFVYMVRCGDGTLYTGVAKDLDARMRQVGPGTPCGDLLRRYWIPVVLSEEVAAGGRVKRVQLLGERLIVYRTPSGRPGTIGELCPHRGASLYYGRVARAELAEKGAAVAVRRLTARLRPVPGRVLTPTSMHMIIRYVT